MIEPVKPSGNVDFVPQAILDLPIERTLAGFRSFVAHGYDDLDEYYGTDFVLDKKYFVAVRHYQGHPKGTTTIYIDRRESDIDHITDIIQRILKDLDVSPTALQWERRQSPSW